MKKTTKLFAGILISTMFMLAGCVQNSPSSSTSVPDASSLDSTISGDITQCVVSPVSESVDIKDEAIASYDFTKLFTITENGENVAMDPAWIDASAVLATPGTYSVTCTYGDVSASIQVNVIETVYEVLLSVSEITLNIGLFDSYDFKALFSALKDGQSLPITEDMISTNLVGAVGTYTYTVTVKGVSKTLTVHLTNEHDVLIVNTYPDLEVSEEDLADFDCTKLFSLYVDGEAKRVTLDMLDRTALENAVAGNRYAIVMTYTMDDTTVEKTAYIHVKAADALVINAKNVITAPNSEFIDLTELFEIKKGDTVIPVTNDMITGTIDYSKVGENTITLTYEGQTKEAIVEVKRGAIIDYKTSDTVTVKKGTNQDSYLFAKDFVLTINGIPFTGIDGYIDTTDVDFNRVGEYTATLTVPYNQNKFGLSGVKFDYITASITYKVVENNYELSLKSEHVELPVGTTKYNVYNNLSLTINGKNQTFTNNKDYADIITCYAELLSDPIDFEKIAAQEVRIAVYVNGVDNEPVIVSYTLQIRSTVEVTGIDKVIYAEQTLFTTGLFKVTENGEEVTPTYEMITGKVDTFTPGVYTVTMDYKGVKAQAQVVVLDNAIKGVYKTRLETIAEEAADSDEDYGTEVTPTTVLSDLVIDKDGNIKLGNQQATLIRAIDEHTLVVKIRLYEYTMYASNGILVLDPDNSIRLGYNNDKRPMIYFNRNVWTIEQRVTVNYGSKYVLNASYAGQYSIDAFELTSKETQERIWYGLKVHLAEKSGGDTIYTVDWGEVEFAEGFAMQTGVVSALTICNQTYKFTMTAANVGMVKNETAAKKYVNTTFSGTINGVAAQLRADQYEGFSLYIGNVEMFKAGSLEVAEMKNGGVNYAEDIVFLYACDRDEFYSYKFLLDPDNKTFTFVEQDGYLGLYKTDSMYIFLDGYGTGIVNFNTKSYYTTQFTYSVYDQKIEIRYQNTTPSFAYGEGATLFMDSFLNTLTVGAFADESLQGTKFVNSHISRGAIVNVSSYKIGAASDSVAKAQLYEHIEIVTKDGVVSETAKKSYIDTSRIRFNTPGFYQMTITIDGITSYYAIQILDAVYEGNPFVATWGAGVLFDKNSLLIDKYGQVSVSIGGTVYSGDVKIKGTTFTGSASAAGKSVTLSGTQIADGLISVRCGGAVAFNDYFTTGTYTQSGTNGFVLRAVTVGTETTFLYSKGATTLGEVVTVEYLSGTTFATGTIFKVLASDAEIVGKLVSLTDLNKGVVLADVYRGTYALENGELFLDGFGGATIDGAKGTYEMTGRVAFLTIAGEYSVYRLDTSAHTAKKEDVALNNSLLSGKTYKGTHYYMCNDYMYDAETTFIFGENGVVTVKSISSSHDGGEEMCSMDSYAPTFASKDGVKGTYNVKGNKVTVNVGGETFVFKIMNVTLATQLSCESGTVETNEHGQIQAGVVFDKI